MKRNLEICCGDIASVIAAKEGGAERIELCSGLSEGGLTPSIGLIEAAINSGIRNINVLIRPRPGDFLYSEAELEVMATDIRSAINAGANGIVTGVLTPEGDVDKDAMTKIINVAREAAAAKGLAHINITFHRAFDLSSNPGNALEDIITLGCDCILTSGASSSAVKGIPMLGKIIEKAADRIQIMAGSGINPSNASEIMAATGVKAIHATARKPIPSKMKFRRPLVSMGVPGSDEYAPLSTSPDIVARLKALVMCLMLMFSAAAYALTPREALDFLYSGMSLPDKTDYSEQFYLDNIAASLRARDEMPWGDSVPEREFMFFVLPVRVNNENLDNSRMVFYEELKDRVKGLSMKEAILEVNHWCHEKVTYKPSDARTSSPLSSVSQAIGRCGEESTFTVAALRSVGIPARQIYTPRWAHTDDNHAWVEAWADGKWWFLGACEPEPVLNLAWFNAPASRGLLMNTNVAGNYDGPEEVLLRQLPITRINVSSNYAPVSTLPVKVVHKDGTPAAGAKVNFCIYNYAEYYPAVTKTADPEGNASLTSGLGDIIVWATDGENFGMAKGNPKDFRRNNASQPLMVVLDKTPLDAFSMDLDIVPPQPGAVPPTVTAQQRATNDRRMHLEDSIRNAYSATFATPESSRIIAGRLNVDEDALVKILSESRGNHDILVNFLDVLPAEKREIAINILLNVSEKDRRDIPTEVIADHIENLRPGAYSNQEDYYRYVVNPRIENEWLTPWRSRLSKAFSANMEKEFAANPEKLVEWVAMNILPADDENPQKLRMSPYGVWTKRKSDATSRNIFFVAMARTLGIPSRIDPVTGTTEYKQSGETGWIKADFGKYHSQGDTENANMTPKGKLMLTFKPEGYIVDPKYYSQFSISRIENGVARQLEFPEDGTLSQIFKEPVELECGQYMLTSGQRLADGGVLARSEVFVIPENGTVTLPLEIRKDESALSVIGALNAENIYHDIALDADKSILSTTGRGYYVVGLISPNHEPSAHALNDIAAVKERFEKDSRKIMILFEDENKASRFDKTLFPEMPSNLVFGVDNNGTSRKELIESLHLDNPGDPVFAIADTFNRVVWVSTGYTIGIGETILSVLSRLE